MVSSGYLSDIKGRGHLSGSHTKLVTGYPYSSSNNNPDTVVHHLHTGHKYCSGDTCLSDYHFTA